jgi:hypothetical protein
MSKGCDLVAVGSKAQAAYAHEEHVSSQMAPFVIYARCPEDFVAVDRSSGFIAWL